MGINLSLSKIDVDNWLVALRIPAVRGIFGYIIANSKHQIGSVDRLSNEIFKAGANTQQRLSCAIGHCSLPHEGSHYRDVLGLDQLSKLETSWHRDGAITGYYYRSQSRAEQVKGRSDSLFVGPGSKDGLRFHRSPIF